MKRKSIFISILAGLMILLTEENTFAQQDTLKSKNHILIKWTPTALIGYSAIQFAGEFYYNSKHSVQIEYGLIIPMKSYSMTNNRGHRIRLENRTYFNQQNTWYFAPEINFTYVTYDSKQRFSNNWAIDSISGEKYAKDTYFDTAGIRKIIATANFKIGYQYVFKKPKIALDFYLGLGIRYVNTKFTTYPTVGEYVKPIDNWIEAPFKEGNRWTPNGVMGIKIGYQIK